MQIACPTCSVTLACSDDMAGTKVKCGRYGQRILVPMPPTQTKAGTNKTTLGKIVDETEANKTTLGKIVDGDKTPTVPVATSAPPPLPVATPAPGSLDQEDTDEPRKKKKRKRSSRYDDDEFDDEDEFDDDYDDREFERGHRVRCPFCRKKGEPYIREQISQQGWIVFIVLLFVFFPICFIGLFMKERIRYCRRCHSRLDPGGSRF
jgi:hypothetical protein